MADKTTTSPYRPLILKLDEIQQVMEELLAPRRGGPGLPSESQYGKLHEAAMAVATGVLDGRIAVYLERARQAFGTLSFARDAIPVDARSEKALQAARDNAAAVAKDLSEAIIQLDKAVPAGKESPASPPGPPEAVYLGQGRIRIGDDTLCLAGQEATVIEALVDCGAASKADLETKSGYADAVKVLRRIREKKYPILAPYITMAGKRNSGGYRTTIRRPA
jgi:hypothetical protein